MIVVVFCIQVCKRIFPDWTGLEILPNVVLYISATLLTFMVSALSYEWFEKRFIKMKEKFSKVISGDLAKK
jgi:peptidoglycan/LPS O-acetylase OafA/YrhL